MNKKDSQKNDVLYVRSAKGTRCAKELSRDTIDDSKTQAVPNTVYYRRLIAEGSLVQMKSN